jgi:hypothetical protein
MCCHDDKSDPPLCSSQAMEKEGEGIGESEVKPNPHHNAHRGVCANSFIQDNYTAKALPGQ